MTLDDRLDNWGRAMRWYAANASGTCASLEGHYRSPQPWHAIPPSAVPNGIDGPDAQAVESAVAVLSLFDHMLLRAWYVRRTHGDHCISLARRAAGTAAPKGRGFQQHMADAKSALQAALALPAVIRKDRARARVRAILGDPLRETT